MLGGFAVLALMLAAGGACGDPAGVTIDANASGAAYDGGHTFGSGNGAASDSGTAATTQSDTTQRGGVLIGSGH